MDKPADTKLFRCAIYTRKSTEHNLDLEFNSLHAQREACEAYIKSQTHEGWRLVHYRFDDGAFSGASLERPALQELLTEVRAGQVDVIVVYKVDRLTRSLSDFAKLVELFDQHSVSFVSVTQSFNTTTSMGRLTLNVLLSFAQYRRAGARQDRPLPKRRAYHLGEHEPILDRSLFDAVQVKLASGANVRQLKLRASPSILAGRIFDERGHRMTPTHTNKNGARYRYYICHALLQRRNDTTTGLRRVSAHEIERAVTKALRGHANDSGADEHSGITDRELVERLVDRIIITSQAIEIFLRQSAAGASKGAIPAVLKVRWKGPEVPNAKGILHSPSAGPPMIVGNYDVLLTAIAKARAWIADIAEGRAASFAEIAKREGKVERHIRLLAPLAFVSPQFVSGIIDGQVPLVAVTALAKHVSWSWAQQRTDVSS